MTTINLTLVPFAYSKESRTFFVSEKDVQFATAYSVISPKIGARKTFNFSHSTGPEFDPKTEWIYESAEGLKLVVANDAKMTKHAAAAYVAAKIR
jgi:hypothetical protein